MVSSSGVSMLAPDGWLVVDDVSGSGARAPVPSLADATGRHVAAQLGVRRLTAPLTAGSPAWGWAAPPGGAVPQGPGRGSESADDPLTRAARSRVAGAFAEDPSAVLLDASHRTVRTTSGGEVRALRLDVVEHDMSTPVVRTSVLLLCTDLGAWTGPGTGSGTGTGAGTGAGAATRPRVGTGSTGVVEASATVPVAHHRALVHAVEAALASVTVRDDVVLGPPDATGDDGGLLDLHELDQGRWYVPPAAWLGAEELDVFVRGSHRLAPAHRAGPARAGLVDAGGRSTPAGDLVRRALHRPDVRVHLRAAHPADQTVEGDASMIVDRLGPWAVVRSTPPPVAVRPGDPVAGHRYLEVVDVAAAPARVVSWTGTGPGRSARVPDALALTLLVSRSGQTWGRPVGEAVPIPRGASPRDVWQQVLAALV